MPKNLVTNPVASEVCGIGEDGALVGDDAGVNLAAGGGEVSRFNGGVGSGRVESVCMPKPSATFSGLAGRKPAPTMAAFSSS